MNILVTFNLYICFTNLVRLNLVEFAYGGLILSSSHLSILPELPQNILALKVVKSDSKIFMFSY